MKFFQVYVNGASSIGEIHECTEKYCAFYECKYTYSGSHPVASDSS